MKDFSIELSAESIVDPRTREYFEEVLKSYINGCHRSAVVMLWSVVVADVVYKLQTLRDLYQDQTAISILDAIEKKQQAAPTNPDWEIYLVDEVNTRTNLFEIGDYQHLVNLQKLRHLSAHPVLSSANLLFSPNKETARSAIRNALEGVLLKPPIFSKKVVTELVSDLAAKKALLPDKATLKQYLEAKYFRNLHRAVELELIKTLWKFCFRLSNVDTDANREINVRVLSLLYLRNPVDFKISITQNSGYFSEIAPTGEPLKALIFFLAEFPALYSALTDAAKIPLATFAQANINLLTPASYLSESFSLHLAALKAKEYGYLREITDENWQLLVSKGRESGTLQEVFSIGTKIYCGSGVFDTADSNFARFIDPYITEYDHDRLVELLLGIEGNNQTYWRGRAQIDHPKIAARAQALGGIDIEQYPHFKEYLPPEE